MLRGALQRQHLSQPTQLGEVLVAKVVVSKEEEKAAGKTVLRHCVCPSTFQDEKYHGLRVHNVGKGKVHCTVCGTEKLK